MYMSGIWISTLGLEFSASMFGKRFPCVYSRNCVKVRTLDTEIGEVAIEKV